MLGIKSHRPPIEGDIADEIRDAVVRVAKGQLNEEEKAVQERLQNEMGTLENYDIYCERAEDISALLNFKCGIKQMDDFIRNKHKGLQKHIELGLSHLWLVYEKEKVIAFFALSKDALTLNSEDKHMIEMRQKTDFFPHFDEEHFWIQEKYAAIEIDYLVVAEEKQRKGIGSFIIASIEEYARNDKLSSTLFLTVEALNSKEQNSIEFYNKCGFRLSEVGKTRNENMERDGDLPLTVRMYKRILPAKE